MTWSDRELVRIAHDLPWNAIGELIQEAETEEARRSSGWPPSYTAAEKKLYHD